MVQVPSGVEQLPGTTETPELKVTVWEPCFVELVLLKMKNPASKGTPYGTQEAGVRVNVAVGVRVGVGVGVGVRVRVGVGALLQVVTQKLLIS